MGLFDTATVGNPMFNVQPNSPALPAAPVATASTPGVNPMSLISMAGMIAGALAPKDSWQAKLGTMAAQTAKGNLLADAQLKRDNDYRKFLSEALKFHKPEDLQRLMSTAPTGVGFFNPTNGVGSEFYPAPKTAGGENG